MSTKVLSLVLGGLAVFALHPVRGDTGRPKTVVDQSVVRSVTQKLTERMGAQVTIIPVYVGSEACMACHKDYQTYRSSLHATGLKMAPDASNSMKLKDDIIAD